MKDLLRYSKDELAEFEKAEKKRYDIFKEKNLRIDMSRGKPGADQLDLSNKVLTAVNPSDGYLSEDGTDCRNYGVPAGLIECRRLFGEIIGVDARNVIVGGNSSLNLMFDYMSQCITHGAGDLPWSKLDDVKFICVVPGYDRHFSICEFFNIKMINVPIDENGPDMDLVEKLINDPSVKGMFCVPKYSNPDGITFSDEVVERLAAMKPAALDFRVFWDNAYAIHDLYEKGDELKNILTTSAKYGNQDNFVVFASTSKITFPGAGVAALATSEKNIEMILKRITMQTIGHDKLNQLRHTKAFPNAAALHIHMQQHAKILKPKFEAVIDILNKELSGLGIASWNVPHGGYFISLNVDAASAKRVGELCKDAGLVLTPVGATYPYGKDIQDRNIRIAPTFPPVEELKTACELLCVAVKLAACEAAKN